LVLSHLAAVARRAWALAVRMGMGLAARGCATGPVGCSSWQANARRRWAEQLKQRRGHTSAAVALAAKHARISGAIRARGLEDRQAASRRGVVTRTQGAHLRVRG
jgi:hypothetical protein